MGLVSRLRVLRAGPVAPLAWLIVVLALDLGTGPAFVPAVLYAIAPLISSVLFRPLVTAGFGATAFLLTTGSVVKAGDWGTAEAWVPMLDAALVGGVAVLLAVVRVRREAQLARMVRIAEVAQRQSNALSVALPTIAPDSGRGSRTGQIFR